MPFLYKDKMQSNRIYKADALIIDTKASNKAIVILGDPYNVDSFVEGSDKFKFVPNVPKKIHFPSFSVQFPNLNKLTSTSIRDSHYNELKSHRIVYNKLLDLSKFPKEYLEKPVIIDFSMYRENFNKYALRNRKEPSAMMGYLRTIMAEIKTLIAVLFIVVILVTLRFWIIRLC